jgi:hypothetical protein
MILQKQILENHGNSCIGWLKENSDSSSSAMNSSRIESVTADKKIDSTTVEKSSHDPVKSARGHNNLSPSELNPLTTKPSSRLPSPQIKQSKEDLKDSSLSSDDLGNPSLQSNRTSRKKLNVEIDPNLPVKTHARLNRDDSLVEDVKTPSVTETDIFGFDMKSPTDDLNNENGIDPNLIELFKSLSLDEFNILSQSRSQVISAWYDDDRRGTVSCVEIFQYSTFSTVRTNHISPFLD